MSFGKRYFDASDVQAHHVKHVSSEDNGSSFAAVLPQDGIGLAVSNNEIGWSCKSSNIITRYSLVLLESAEVFCSLQESKELKIYSSGSTSGIRACCEALNKKNKPIHPRSISQVTRWSNQEWEQGAEETVGTVEQAYEPTTAEEKQDRRNEMKARETLLMALPNKDQLKFHSYQDAKLLMEAIEKRYGGNKESKKVQKTLLKQQYENFAALSLESIDQTFNRLQKLIGQFQIQGEVINQEDMNLKLMRNKVEIETISLDDLYNNLKIYEPEIIDDTAHEVSATYSTTHTQGNGVKSVCLDNLCDDVICAFLVSQPNSPQLSQEDLEQLHPDDLEEIDLQWEMAMLTIRARRFIKRTGKKLDINGQRVGFDKSKVECFNYHCDGHFARECRFLRNQEYKMSIPGLKTLSSFSDENDNKVSITVDSKKNRSSRLEE
ncbi:hypothetical protein Tco_1476779 [Tanacetum coccineum]